MKYFSRTCGLLFYLPLKENIVNKQYATAWRGADWYFANADNMSLFITNPKKYAPQYGGYCDYAMSNDSFTSIDEEAFTIYKDKHQ